MLKIAVLYRAIIVVAAALAIAVSFHGPLDRFAQREIANTTTESIGIFLVSRAINATVSVLQTSEVKLPLVASAQVGQALDPINDAIERLSSIMVWALGSLVFQRILLEVAASPVFKWILFLIGAAMTALLLMEWCLFRVSPLERLREWLVRLFVVATIARFIVPAFIAVSFLVSQTFLQSDILKNTEQLSLLETQVSDIASSQTPDPGQLEEEKARLVARIEALEASRASAREEIERLDARIEKSNDELGLRRLIPDSFRGGSDSQELRAAKDRRQTLDREIQRAEDAIRETKDALECIDTRIAGGSCDSMWKRGWSAATTGASQIKETFGKLTEMATAVTMLLVAVAIKNIIFPILFLMGAVKCSLPIVRHTSRLLAGVQKDVREVKEATRQIASHTEPPGGN